MADHKRRARQRRMTAKAMKPKPQRAILAKKQVHRFRGNPFDAGMSLGAAGALLTAIALRNKGRVP